MTRASIWHHESPLGNHQEAGAHLNNQGLSRPGHRLDTLRAKSRRFVSSVKVHRLQQADRLAWWPKNLSRKRQRLGLPGAGEYLWPRPNRRKSLDS